MADDNKKLDDFFNLDSGELTNFTPNPKSKDQGEERVMTPPAQAESELGKGENSSASTTADEPKDEDKDEKGKESESEVDNKGSEDKSSAEQTETTDSEKTDETADDKKTDSEKTDEKTADGEKEQKEEESEVASLPSGEVDQTPSDNGSGAEVQEEKQDDGFEKDATISLKNYKKASKSNSRIKNFIAEICDMDGYKAGSNKKMSNKLALANMLWLSAKLSVACVVLGPIAGTWLVAHYTNHAYASKVEGNVKNVASKVFDLLGKMSGR